MINELDRVLRFWKKRDGSSIRIRDMDDEYLWNAIGFMRRYSEPTNSHRFRSIMDEIDFRKHTGQTKDWDD